MGIRDRIHALERDNSRKGVAREGDPFILFQGLKQQNEFLPKPLVSEIAGAAIRCPTLSKFRLASCSRC
jgi:hypothetical protein